MRLFEAPEGHDPLFAWVCGYSADALCINDMAERFTGATADLRAAAGHIRMGLILDPGNVQLPLADIPGVAHLPMLAALQEPRAFALMHAKIALMGFRDHEDPARWRLRLVVSTGNWTTETLESSLDLAWTIELSSSEINTADGDVQQRCADISAAADLMSWLRERYDTQLLLAPSRGEPGETAQAIDLVDTWIVLCTKAVGDKRPRFFDSRRDSLHKQIPALVKGHAQPKRRQHLIMGSGFYEGGGDGALPSVPASIVEQLVQEGLLTASAAVTLVVNPSGCQAVALSMKAIHKAGWTVRPPGRPASLYGSDSRRELHAKFLFSCNSQEGSGRCTSGWVYLGSGNLTQPGFTRRAGAAGNLEAGVVFATGEMRWQPEVKVGRGKGMLVTHVEPGVLYVTETLPYQELELLTPDKPPAAGDDMPEREAAWLAPPVPWLQWEALPGQEEGRLRAPGPIPVGCELLDSTGAPCARDGDAWRWPAALPRQVALQWLDDEGVRRRALIPVQDGWGRMAATPLGTLSLGEVARRLDAFPLSMVEDDDDEGGAGDNAALILNAESPRTTRPANAIREMLAQIEAIASRQATIAESDWKAWCLRLEQSLVQAGDSREVDAFVQLKLNPLPALRSQGFVPAYASAADSESHRRLQAALQRVAQAWGMEGFADLGEHS
ncbi:hypothetical protein GHT07_20955 [Caenimonas koreensis DSM 17982]|uniref:Uncharacterized protein n=1 Tax=Caenimonas koreensis DSM 17982 TaxID=1121255 RepID=A0A844AZH6_9BURK|nr:hypothetical protein [Caenimonas koreensis]MRD49745.1 hypothetical protein [Caenimonas koreensis DSM 17982]